MSIGCRRKRQHQSPYLLVFTIYYLYNTVYNIYALFCCCSFLFLLDSSCSSLSMFICLNLKDSLKHLTHPAPKLYRGIKKSKNSTRFTTQIVSVFVLSSFQITAIYLKSKINNECLVYFPNLLVRYIQR